MHYCIIRAPYNTRLYATFKSQSTVWCNYELVPQSEEAHDSDRILQGGCDLGWKMMDLSLD